MIFKHYRELVTEKEADAWFGVTPVAVEAAKARMEKERRAKVVKLCSGNHSGQSEGKRRCQSADPHGLQSAFDHRNACEFSFHKSEHRQRCQRKHYRKVERRLDIVEKHIRSQGDDAARRVGQGDR